VLSKGFLKMKDKILDSNKENKNMNPTEIGVIRDILMGQQMADYEKRFESMQQFVDAKDGVTKQRIEALEKELKAEMNARFDKIEHLLLLHVEQINQRMQMQSRQDKHQLADMLIEMSGKLKGNTPEKTEKVEKTEK
jgi:SUMO ligase MMS21 Smc5/6 complex component